jgi:hypothetical protein
MADTDTDPTARVERRLRILKLVLGIVATALTVLKLLGAL